MIKIGLTEILIFAIRFFYKIFYTLLGLISQTFTLLKLCINRVEYGTKFHSNGIPRIVVKKSGTFRIGNNFSINNGKYFNQIGRQQVCYFIVGENAKLIIGNKVGMSSTAIICMQEIVIEDNVKIGGNTVIYDTDFHSINPYERLGSDKEDSNNINKKPVIIKKNAFIGAHSTILKGITIGENSVIGACSVVTKNVPKNEIWAGNPARFIKNI